MPTNCLVSAIQQFAYYQQLGQRALEQVPDEALFWQYNNASNSMAVIVKHLWGNMLSRWTDFLHSDGEKTWREREAEFDNDLRTRQQVMQLWQDGWQCVFAALNGLKEADLAQIVHIRAQPLTVAEAIMRQLAHYASHVGQLIYIGKMVRDGEWQTLSIPRGGSAAFNAGLMGK